MQALRLNRNIKLHQFYIKQQFVKENFRNHLASRSHQGIPNASQQAGECDWKGSDAPHGAHKVKTTEYRKSYFCPSCGQQCYRLPVLQRHLERCCPDILQKEEWTAASIHESELEDLLHACGAREEVQRNRILDLTFRQRDELGQPYRQEIDAVAKQMGLSLQRAQRLLQFAMRAVPLAADNIPVEVIYEDDDLLAVNKPPGVITAPKHRFTGGSLVNRIIGTLGFEPLTIHRLDMNTSGVVLFAKKRDIVPHLHAQFREKEVQKEYLALSVGVPDELSFTVDAPIDRDEREKVARCVSSTGKAAVTSFQVLASNNAADLSLGCPAQLALFPSTPRGACMLQCRPVTGRTHQIRVHLAHHGYPIIGDDIYGLVGPWLRRQALHANSLAIIHPRSGDVLNISAPLPQDMMELCRTFNLSKCLTSE